MGYVRILTIGLVLLLWSCLFSQGTKRYGEKCNKYTSKCGGRFINNMHCKNGTCVCDSLGQMKYDSSGNPTCDFLYFSRIYFGEVDCQRKCENHKDAKGVECQGSNCVCKPDLHRVGVRQCRPGVFVGPGDTCSVDPELKLCNYRNNSYCSNSKCACFGTHYLNFTTKECVEKSVFTKMHKLTEYKALPLQYCLSSGDCVDGLECWTKEFKCKCPSGCHYEEDKLRCSCGKVEFSSPISVLWVGLILSILSICFWGCVIKRTCRKKGKKSGGDATSEYEYNGSGGYDNNKMSQELNAASDGMPSANVAGPASSPPYPTESSSENQAYLLNGEGTATSSGGTNSHVGPPYPLNFPGQPQYPTGTSATSAPASQTPYPLTSSSQNTSSFPSAHVAPYPPTSSTQNTSADPSAPYPLASSTQNTSILPSAPFEFESDVKPSEPFTFQPMQGTFYSPNQFGSGEPPASNAPTGFSSSRL